MSKSPLPYVSSYMTRKIFLFLLFMLAVSLSVSYAAGNTGLAFLKIGVSARTAAMGEAYVATADDASGLFWNPAGSAFMEKRQAHFTHTEWIQGITNEMASVALPTCQGVLGLQTMLNNVDGIERRVIASEEPLGTVSAHDFLLGLSFSKRLYERFAVGLSAKYLYEKIYLESASGLAMDLGVRYWDALPGLSLGASLQNIGSMNRLEEEKIALPRIARVGAAYVLPFSIANSTLLLASEFVQIFDDESHFNIGGEFRPVSLLSLRAGYQTGHRSKGTTAGFGLNFRRLTIDYAYVPFSADLGNTQRFSFLVNF
jgi:hypothetical protein